MTSDDIFKQQVCLTVLTKDSVYQDQEYLFVRESSCWEVITSAQMGIVTFRFVREGWTPAQLDTISQRIVDEMIADGFAMISTTSLRGRTVLRLCTINPRTTEDDMRETIQKLEECGNHLISQ